MVAGVANSNTGQVDGMEVLTETRFHQYVQLTFALDTHQCVYHAGSSNKSKGTIAWNDYAKRGSGVAAYWQTTS
jgi:hypothetical protein